jgi:nitronate monooxygenase
MMALSDHGNLITAAIDERVDFIFIGAGMWLRVPRNVDMDLVRESPTKIVPIVSSARTARIIFKYWARHHGHVPDAVVVEGPKAGGHIGFAREDVSNPEYALENVLPQVIESVRPYREQFAKNIPVIAAGGIFSGEDIYHMLRLGADGVQMGTRFVATHECDASLEFKEMYVNSTREDMVLISSPVGMPGRAIRNRFLDEVLKGRRIPIRCPWKCLQTCDFKQSPYCIAKALVNARMGKITQGFAFAGLNAYRIEKIISVRELIQTLVEEYESTVRDLLSSGDVAGAVLAQA